MLCLPLLSLCCLPVLAQTEDEVPIDPWQSRLVVAFPDTYAEDADFRFSHDGKRLAYAVHDAKGQTVLFIDGEEQGSYDYLNLPVFSADGEHVAWTAGDRKTKKTESWASYLDGKRLKKYDWAGPMVLGPEGKKWAFWAGKGVKLNKEGWYSGGDYFIVYGKKKVAKTSGQPEWKPALSPNGKELAWSILEGSYKVIHGKEEYGPYQWVSGLQWSGDSKHLVWQAAKPAEATMSFGDPGAANHGRRASMQGSIYLDGVALDHGYEAVASPALAPKGKKVCFVAQEADKVFVVVEEKAWASRWDQLSSPLWSPDGKSVAAIANEGMKRAGDMPMLDTNWLDGMEFGVYDEATGRIQIREPEGECWLMVDDTKVAGPFLRALDPTWSADSQSVACRAQVADGWVVAVGEDRSEVFDEISMPVFHPDGSKVAFGARKGREIHWQVLSLTPAK